MPGFLGDFGIFDDFWMIRDFYGSFWIFDKCSDCSVVCLIIVRAGIPSLRPGRPGQGFYRGFYESSRKHHESPGRIRFFFLCAWTTGVGNCPIWGILDITL